MTTILQHEQQALDAFQSNVAELAQKELDRLEAEREQLEIALTSVRGALRSVKATLHASTPKQSRNGSKPKSKKNASMWVPGDTATAEFHAWLKKQPDDRDLTAKMLYEAEQFPYSSSYCNTMFKWARENGYLRQSGQAGSTRIYRKLG